MSDSHALHTSLLRPAILHILRAQGFHSTRPSVLDTLTDLCARHLLLIGQKTAQAVYDRTSNDAESPQPDEFDPTSELQKDPSDIPATKADAHAPTLTDVRNALEASFFFSLSLTGGEEAWREVLRKPLSAYPAGAAREKERARRDAEDTRDVREFVDWCSGPVNKEIRRIAGVLEEDGEGDLGGLGEPASGAEGTALDSKKPTAVDAVKDGQVQQTTGRVRKDDYVAALKKKHSKTGDGARYAGTALGKPSEEKGVVRIDGGPESIEEWRRGLKRKQIAS